MTRFREKFLDFKKRLSKGKMYSITILLVGLIGGFGAYQHQRANGYRHQLETNYNRAFFDMIGYVQNVDTLLSKSLITTTPQKTSHTLQEAWRQSNLAQENLGLLPVSQTLMANTSKFLTQVGDMSYSLSNQIQNGRPLSNDQYDTLEVLQRYSTDLKNSLFNLQDEISLGRINWGELREKGAFTLAKASSNLPNNQFENIDKGFKEYPTLIYDGPFSDHMTASSPLGLTGNNISASQAKTKVLKFIGEEKVSELEYLGKDENNTMESFNFRVKLQDSPDNSLLNIAITEKGGHPLWMIYHRPTNRQKITVQTAKREAKSFLESRGFHNMVDTYFLKEDGFATINYAYTQNDVIMYPDLIKVKVALDNGEIVGFESKGYLSAHHERNIPEVKISMEEARKKINPRMEILDSGFAFIPTEFKTEVFVYEFTGKMNEQNFIVYINAQTGIEEDILILLETPNGILTM
jgi:spore germination protein